MYSKTLLFIKNKMLLSCLAMVLLVELAMGQTLSVTRRYGSTGADAGTAAYIDAAGNSYIAGTFNNTVSFGATTLTAAGVNNGYIIKNSSGGVVQWVKGFIGTGAITINDIVVDASGNVFLGGNFSGSMDFDPGLTTSIIGSNNNSLDMFAAKLSSTGNFIWAKSAGGNVTDFVYSIDLDNNGDIVIGGSADDNGIAIDFDPSAQGTFTITTTSRDGILWRLDAFNGTYVGVGRFGGTNADEIRKVLVNRTTGDIYVAGTFGLTMGTLTGTGGIDGFINKYNSSYVLQWQRKFGGATNENQAIYDMDLTAAGDIITMGTFVRTSEFDYTSTLGGLGGSANGVNDGYICKLNAAGAFQWVKPIIGTALDAPKKVKVNTAGDIIVAGAFQETTDFDPSTLTSSFTSKGGYDAFIAKYDANGNFTNNIQTFGDVGDDFVNGLAINGLTFHVTGSFNNIIDVSSTTTPTNITSSGLSDAFFMSYTACTMPPTPSMNITASTLNFCNASVAALLQVNAFPVNTTVRWFANNTTTSTLQSAASYSYTTIALTTTTSFYVSASNICGESARLRVNVSKTIAPVVAIASSPNSVCFGQNATLTGSNANTYTWVGGPATNKYVVSPTVNTVYTVTGVSTGAGCTDTKTYSLIVKSLPGITVVATRNNYCTSGSNNTGLTASGASTYVWQHSNDPSAATTVNPPIGNTLFTVTGISAQGCANNGFITITLNGLPAITAAYAKPAYCKSEITITTLSGASLYKFGTGAFSTNPVSSRSFTIAGNNATSWVAVSAANCSVTGSFNVSVVSPPVISGSISSIRPCVGVTTTITRIGGIISWPNNAGLTIINTSTTSINPSVTTTSFVITATGIPGCISTENITISRDLVITPSANISATQTNICSGTSVTFSGFHANANSTNVTYNWFKNGFYQGASNKYVSNTLVDNDQIKVTIDIVGGNCITATTATSNIITMTGASVSPSVSISTANTTICSADIASFTANITNGGSNPTITWKVGNNSFNQNNTSFSSLITNGQIVSCVITSNGSCLTTQTATSSGIAMTVKQSTALVNLLPSTLSTTCGTITYSLTATGLNNSFEWSNGFTSVGNVSSISASASGNYSATVTGTCNAIASNVNNLTVYNATQIMSPLTNITLCGGDFTTFSVPIGGDNLKYLWSNGETTPDIYTSTAGIYAITATGSCGTDISNTATIVANEVTTIVTQPFSASVVAGNSATFTASATGTNISYLWNIGETTNAITTSIEGTYQVTISGTCGEIISNAVTLSTTLGCVPPSITTQPQSATVCSGLSTTISVVTDGTNLSYLWSNGATTPDITVSLADNYTVTVTGSCGNAISSVATIGVDICLGLKTKNNTKSDLITLFPNPTESVVYIENAKGNKLLFNSQGQLLQSFESNQCDLTGLNSGLYFIKIENKIFKIIKQ